MFPIRYNPMRIVIQKRQVSQAIVDVPFNVPIGQIPITTNIEIQGQVNIKGKNFFSLDPTNTGNAQRTNGKIFIKKAHYTTTIDVGDKIVEFGPSSTPTSVNGMVIKVRGGCPLNGDFLYMIIEFEEDREGHSS